MNVSRMVYLTNHDQNWNEKAQTMSAKYGDNRYLLTVYVATIWGMPLVYNGQEIGGDQALSYFADTKIDWTQVDDKMYNTIRTLSAIKHTQQALFDSSVPEENAEVDFLTTNDNQVLAYKRVAGDSEVLVILNAAVTAKQVVLSDIQGEYSLWLDSETIEKGVSRHGETFSGNFSKEIPAKGYLVYVKGSFPDEEIPTGISQVHADSRLNNEAYYNLNGMAVDRFSDGGILIHHGRKYISKNS